MHLLTGDYHCIDIFADGDVCVFANIFEEVRRAHLKAEIFKSDDIDRDITRKMYYRCLLKYVFLTGIPKYGQIKIACREYPEKGLRWLMVAREDRDTGMLQSCRQDLAGNSQITEGESQPIRSVVKALFEEDLVIEDFFVQFPPKKDRRFYREGFYEDKVEERLLELEKRCAEKGIMVVSVNYVKLGLGFI